MQCNNLGGYRKGSNGNKIARIILIISLGFGNVILLTLIFKIYIGPSVERYSFNMNLINKWAYQEIRGIIQKQNSDIDIDSIRLKNIEITINSGGKETITIEMIHNGSGVIIRWIMVPNENQFKLKDE